MQQHPSDELLQNRKTIKMLRQRNAELRARIAAGQCGTMGETSYATIRHSVHVTPLPAASYAHAPGPATHTQANGSGPPTARYEAEAQL